MEWFWVIVIKILFLSDLNDFLKFFIPFIYFFGYFSCYETFANDEYYESLNNFNWNGNVIVDYFNKKIYILK